MTLDPLHGVKNARIAAAACVLAEHKNAENTDVGASSTANETIYYDNFANGATMLSQSITITKRCCIVVVTTCVTRAYTPTQIQRGGVNKTIETTYSAGNFAIAMGYAQLQYATEVLDAGIYQYDLVNTSGAVLQLYGSTMKIVAVSAT
jgi:hypothetical protein